MDVRPFDCEVDQLLPVDNMDVGVLARLGLATIDQGRGGQVWARLTEKGRKVRELGQG